MTDPAALAKMREALERENADHHWHHHYEWDERAVILAEHGELAESLLVSIRRNVAGMDIKGAVEVPPALAVPPLNPVEPWAVRANADAVDEAWAAFLAHLRTAQAGRPSNAWIKRASALLAALGPQAPAALAEWAELAPVTAPEPIPFSWYGESGTHVWDAFNATALKGLLWTLPLLPASASLARAVGRVVERALRKIPGVGPQSPKLANAAVYALSAMEGPDALAQLARLASTVTFKGTLKQIDAALDRRALAMGLTRDRIEEMAVPHYGLTEVGRLAEELDGVTVELLVDPSPRLAWTNAAGKTVKSVPASVRRDHAERLAELKGAVKDIAKMLTAQAERLDSLFLAEREWAMPEWREYYLDHPLVGTLARRLLWLVGDAVCAWDGGLVALDGTPVPDGPVRLWHPIGREIAEVMAARAWLAERGVVQPFKQAHREVYLLTAAEENTGTYSNRYAAHVLRQHQFHALASARGWADKLRLMVDDSYPPATRELARWNLRAEYWVEGAGDDWNTDTTEAGTYLRLITDQVRFYPLDAPTNWAHAGGGGYGVWGTAPGEPLPLDTVPPLVFSEIMRDVDLFVGVASVGNDPTWQDGGPEGRFQNYWREYAFGDLSGTAQTRREILTALVPRLAIADRAHVDGRFLVVRGDLRTYKIHLGSGNILMDPGDQYLCIVPGQAKDGGDKVFLPFEGDRTLAIVLSKALMLARDTEITDPTITRQIRR
ncbi:hypothetical protein Afil01_68830 [Actinorhabdospora filicis]|uniref:DUF4132 domain-containing protein n=1 Tax=Actinorhabdospora filicis TaxID=1785913 RepID=A0A9W6SWM0_9ACTN|nr:DUF4132 domain-containing protein [Actinorhabdospora filicis]GLZ82076.1 hypothetical protein Afil01_68830 [Actinorhabdospora filicis]